MVGRVACPDGAALLLLLRGQEDDEVGRELRILRIFGDGELPAAERAGVLAVGAALGQGHDADLALDRLVGAVAGGPGIRPVAHEGGIARLEDAARLLLAIVEHAVRRDLADPGRGQRDRLGGLGIVDGDGALLVDDGAAAEANRPIRARRRSGPHRPCPGRHSPRTCRCPPCARRPGSLAAASVSSCQVAGGLTPYFSSRSVR